MDRKLTVDMCSMLIANGFPATIRKLGKTFEHYADCWRIDVVDIKHREIARELIRGFKSALPVRGMPGAFVQGVVNGFYYKYKTDPAKLSTMKKVKLLPPAKDV